MGRAPATWIALLRGINVGGSGRLPMKELVALLEGLGLSDVRTYVQSGNAVFRWRGGVRSELAARIAGEIRRRHGFEPAVLVLAVHELEQVIRANPFPEAVDEPKSLLVFFLRADPVAPDLEGLDRNRRDRERFVLRERLFYLHAPEGIARSKLAVGAEKLLGVPATARNWRTVTRVLALAQELTEAPP